MDEAERDRLVAALRQRGVDYLAPSDAQGAPLDDPELIERLAGHADPRLRQALIALFLGQPQLASVAASLRPALPEPASTKVSAGKHQFHEILPQMELKSLRQDSAEFEKIFRALESLWRSAGGNP